MDKFAALAEPNRRRIIALVAAHGPMAATRISAAFDISAPAVSQHLKVLREAALLNVERRAQQRIYSINPQGMDEMWAWLNQMRQFWDVRFDALDTVLRQEGNTE